MSRWRVVAIVVALLIVGGAAGGAVVYFSGAAPGRLPRPDPIGLPVTCDGPVADGGTRCWQRGREVEPPQEAGACGPDTGNGQQLWAPLGGPNRAYSQTWICGVFE